MCSRDDQYAVYKSKRVEDLAISLHDDTDGNLDRLRLLLNTEVDEFEAREDMADEIC